MNFVAILALTYALIFTYNIDNVNGIIYCDNDYNTSSCANTTLNAYQQYYCRGFLSCKDSTVDTVFDLICQGDRACKNVNYDNSDNDELKVYGYQSADSLTMSSSAQDAYCYGYQSCLDITFAQTTTDNDAEAYGYQAMYSSYIDFSDSVVSNGYESLYYATINTTTVSGNEIDITVNGYYGSYETDIFCQDGITCNFYAYGYYATEETYLFCKPGAECNVYCGTTNGCSGMNLYCYSTATCYFDCDDADDCPTESDAYSLSALAALTKEEKTDGKTRYSDSDFDKIMEQRLRQKYEKQYEFKQERLREEKTYTQQQQQQQASSLEQNKNNQDSTMSSSNDSEYYKTALYETGVIFAAGMVVGMLGLYSYNKCVAKKDYQYQSIV